MAKRNTEAQDPEEEIQVQEQEAEATGEDVQAQGQETQEPEEAQPVDETDGDAQDQQDDGAQDGDISIMVLQTKDSESKVAEILDDGWEAGGVALVESNGETLLVVALNESQLKFGGDESQDLDEDVASPSMAGLDGEQRSAFLIAFYQRKEKEVPALSACAKYGWLPSGGEMALIFANKDAINAMLETLGGDTLGDGKYWTSQRFSNDRMWSCNMSDGTFGIALSTASVAAVRAVKK